MRRGGWKGLQYLHCLKSSFPLSERKYSLCAIFAVVYSERWHISLPILPSQLACTLTKTFYPKISNWYSAVLSTVVVWHRAIWSHELLARAELSSAPGSYRASMFKNRKNILVFISYLPVYLKATMYEIFSTPIFRENLQFGQPWIRC